MLVQSLGWEDLLEKAIATHSSILAWKIPMDRGASWATVHGVAKDQIRLRDSACTHTHTHTHTQNKEGPQPNMTGDLIRGILETEAHTGGMPGEMKAETYTPRNTNDC